MKNVVRLALSLCALLAVSSATHAQGIIRFVASYGNDANPCTRPAPCRTLQAGINATPAGSELQVIDSGGYGQNVTINKGITISATGVTATLISTTGTGITITAGASDIVALRGLTLSRVGSAGLGILINSAGTVHIERCEIERFSGGISYISAGKLFVKDTISRDNFGAGLETVTNTGESQVTIVNSQFLNNAGGGVSFASTDGLLAIIRDSVASGNGAYGFAVFGDDSDVILTNCTAADNDIDGFAITDASSEMSLEHCVAHGNNGSGMSVANGIIRVSNSVATNNQIGWEQISGDFKTRQNNFVDGNTINFDGAFTPIPPA